MKKKICIIGCGGLTETFYLPNFENKNKEIELYFVDNNAKRLEEFCIKSSLESKRCFKDLNEALDLSIDAYIIATPPSSHFSLIKYLLDSNKYILCEKPAVETYSEFESIINNKNFDNSKMLVNNTRRFFPSYKKVKQLIADNTIGEIKKVEYYEGNLMNWNSASNSYFKSEGSPKGILLDRGAHVLDAVTWWTDDNPDIIESKNDSQGGPESLAYIKMQSSNIEYNIKLSWLNKLSNMYKVTGDKGIIYGDIYDWNRVNIENGQKNNLNLNSGILEFTKFGEELISNFIAMIYNNSEPKISFKDVATSIKLISDSYENAVNFDFSWLQRMEK